MIIIIYIYRYIYSIIMNLYDIPSYPLRRLPHQRRRKLDNSLDTLVVKLSPFLIRNGNDFQTGISTGTKIYDDLIQFRIANDYTNIKSIFTNDYQVIDYNFDGQFVYITLVPLEVKQFRPNEIHKISEEIVDPNNIGPDTWMERDIVILSEEEAHRTKKFNNSVDSIELGVEVVL
jgi:hypothetical protein